MTIFTKLLVFGCCLLAINVPADFLQPQDQTVSIALTRFRADSKLFASRISLLDSALQKINPASPQTIDDAKEALIASRIAYKRIEYFLEYFFATSSRVYNRAPKNEIEEPYLEFQELAGLQYIETLLYESSPEKYRSTFREQTRLLSLAAYDLNALVYKFEASDQQLIESIRLELIRITTLGITGFDAPQLKSGLSESTVALQALEPVLKFVAGQSDADSVLYYLHASVSYLEKNPDFDRFDRLTFLTAHMLPLQKQLGVLITRKQLALDKNLRNNQTEHLFSKNFLSGKRFAKVPEPVSRSQISLGKKLFSDNILSGNERRSCVSCHRPELYFTDGLAKSIGFSSTSVVKRNAPTLLYAKFQHSQFWDGRAKNIAEQVNEVIHNPDEMSGDMSTILVKLNSDRGYRKLFQKAFSKKRKARITESEIYQALASYVSTLNPMNSPFDRYIRGDKTQLNPQQIAGFNLFMGKAQCGTCHFAPVFNGLIPPLYDLTEFEVLGTTRTDQLEKPEMDTDNGRFEFRPIKFYRGAFKTPTVRNAAKTGPYMHNGAFGSLETLIEFYNQGGGVGLGLDVSAQTLSPGKLNLSESEKKNIIAFIDALTDDLTILKNKQFVNP